MGSQNSLNSQNQTSTTLEFKLLTRNLNKNVLNLNVLLWGSKANFQILANLWVVVTDLYVGKFQICSRFVKKPVRESQKYELKKCYSTACAPPSRVSMIFKIRLSVIHDSYYNEGF